MEGMLSERGCNSLKHEAKAELLADFSNCEIEYLSSFGYFLKQ